MIDLIYGSSLIKLNKVKVVYQRERERSRYVLNFKDLLKSVPTFFGIIYFWYIVYDLVFEGHNEIPWLCPSSHKI